MDVMLGRLLISVLFLILLAPCSLPQEDYLPWWQLDVTLIVQGEYRLDMGDLRWAADYACELRGRSVMEWDDGDYLLYPMDADSSTSGNLVWVESLDGPTRHQVFHCESVARPRVDIRFALREGKMVKIALEMHADISPFHLSGKQFELRLPRTSTGIGEAMEKAYDRGIRSGGNILKWEQKSMDSKEKVEGSIQWEWSEAPGSWSHQHTVKVTFQVVRGARDSN